MRLSQNIAGVTFLAFGNGAPDVFSAIAAVGNSKSGDAGLAFGALFGAGVFISTIIVGTICLISPFYSVQRPLLRDLIFFLAAGFWAFIVIWDQKIQLWETLGFLMLYVVYILVVVLGRYINQKIKYRDGNVVRKNDFSSAPQTSTAIETRRQQMILNAAFYDEESAEEEYENEEVNRPLLTKSPVESLEEEFSTWDAFKNTFIPFDRKEWAESNWILRLVIIAKVKRRSFFLKIQYSYKSFNL
jgi:sodium/potassium/calcium exchanger 6